MGKTFIISDTHFCHKNVIEYEDRPFETVKEMNEVLVKNWNDTVGEKDTIYHLGDFGLGKRGELKEIGDKLNGYKILITGNHDYSCSVMRDLGFISVSRLMVINYKHWKVWLTHYPLNDEDFQTTGFPSLNFHGHIHGKIRVNNNLINMSCDAWDYRPVEIGAVVKEYLKTTKARRP